MSEEMYGSNRLLDAVIRNHELPIKPLVARLIKEHTTFVENCVLRDDFTLLGIEIG